ncbi:probable pectinesterase/pectinesterase inhibitor 21 [Impatiens glandulifera]|uniref:probable pectinesterase/pectinesterase inhibitor 21 n=1 Tax=Impatiens glandulifera TaxID=253017 RepID=UPI001FB0A691|nr:probable pectinesterase/pectinesterase inhibitor 21 [Impatiens glandulifera]
MANQRVVVLGFSSMLLVAMVIGVAVTVTKEDDPSSDGVNSSGLSTTTKSVEAVCQSTDYKDTCVTTLSSSAGGTSDPKELIKIAFNVAIKYVGDAMNNSTVLQQAESDPVTHAAYESCKELLQDSINDLQDTFDKFGTFDLHHLHDYVQDLKTWLSGALTFQETCLDGFENTTGNAGENMKQLLKISGELTRNGLAMVDEFSKTVMSLNVSSFGARRLLSSDGIPYWVDSSRRKLLQAAAVPYPSYTISKFDVDPTPNVVVAKDGSGNVKTIAEALAKVPLHSKVPFVIRIKAGVYAEYVEVTRMMTNVVMLGDGPTTTRITGNKNFADGLPFFKTPTFVVQGAHFYAKGIGFENTAGANKRQASSIRVSADMSIFYQCNFDGYQSTLFTHVHRQYYRECSISGTIDSIFGDASAVFQNCTMVVRKPMDGQSCKITAQGRDDKRANTGLVLQKCSIVAAPEFTSSPTPILAYLGRPWKMYSRTIIVNTNIDGFIDPQGWVQFAGSFGTSTSFFVEFGNTGEGSDKSKRVVWPAIKNMNARQIAPFSASKFISSDLWVKPTGLPYDSTIN